ncbi:MAG: NHL repeat-containing protein [Verrucomicrobiota bacterium]|jgi:sugar lactone lactonase YvrE
MKTIKTLLLSAAMLPLCPVVAGAQAQTYDFITIAGLAQVEGDTDGTNSSVRFTLPGGVALDPGGNVYVADTSNFVIRKLRPAGANWVSSTIAGTAPLSGSTDGTNGAVRFNKPYGLAVDSKTNIYVADSNNDTIRQLTLAGTNWVSSTIAGLALSPGSADGTDNAIRFKTPYGVAVDTNGNVYVADSGNDTIRLLTPSGSDWISSTIAGQALTPGTNDGTDNAALFSGPYGVAVDTNGNVYVADTGNNTIRMLTPSGSDWISSTIAGTAGTIGSADGTNGAISFKSPQGIAVDAAGNVYVGDTGNDTIRKLTPSGANWVSSTIGGSAGSTGSSNGIGSAARFYSPWGVAVDSSGNVYVADWRNSIIRESMPPGAPVFQSATSSNSVLTLTWSATPGKTYQVQYLTNLAQTNWNNLTNSAVAGNSTMSATDSLRASSRRFYRVVQLP